jgi:hypothetical protein
VYIFYFLFAKLLNTHYTIFTTLQIKVGFELKGHTHEDIDQMFSRFSVALLKANMRQLADIVKSIRAGYTPSPHVEVVRCTLNFDALGTTIGKGTIAGIMGSHSAAQEEKPHQMKFIMEEGRAVLYMKRLSTEKVWYPVDRGIKVLRHSRWVWPMQMYTRLIEPANDEMLTQLTRTMGLLDRENTGEDHDAMLKSWVHNLDVMRNPSDVKISLTWKRFLETFNITEEMGLRATPPSKEARRLHALKGVGPFGSRVNTMLPEIRDAMTGLAVDEVAVARESELKRKSAEQESVAKISFTVEANPSTQMGGKRGRTAVKEMELLVGNIYAFITDDLRGWSLGKCLKITGANPDTFEIQWVGARGDKIETGKIVGLIEPGNKKKKPWIQDVEFGHLLPIQIQLNSLGKMTPFLVSKIEEEMRLINLKVKLEETNVKKRKTKFTKTTKS